MTFLATNIFPNVSRHSTASRAAAEMVNTQSALWLNEALSAAGCATAGTASKAKTTNTLTYWISGVFKTLNATDNFWTLGGTTSATTVPASSWQKYLLLVDASGTASVQEATSSTVSAAAVTWKNISGVSKWAPLLSVLNAGKAIVGVATVATDATHTFVPGTTSFAGTGITTTFIDGIDQSLFPMIANQQGTLLGLGG